MADKRDREYQVGLKETHLISVHISLVKLVYVDGRGTLRNLILARELLPIDNSIPRKEKYMVDEQLAIFAIVNFWIKKKLRKKIVRNFQIKLFMKSWTLIFP